MTQQKSTKRQTSARASRTGRDQRGTLVKISEAAEYAGVSSKTIRRRISDGSLRGYRFGTKIILVDLNQVDELIRVVPSAGGDAA